MSKSVKSIASIALPIIGTLVAPGIGTALGSTLSAAATTAIGGAVGGGLGGAVSGGGVKGALKGAAIGGAGGYIAGGGLTDVLGTAAGTPVASGVGPTQGSGIVGAITKGASDLGIGAGAVSSGGSILSKLAPAVGVYQAYQGAQATKDAARLQAESNRAAIQSQQDALSQVRGDLAPFKEAGTSTVGGLTNLVNDPNAQRDFITTNPFYQSLAKDATDRLFANQAAKGKLGSGGTAQALQNSLLLLGSDLLNQDVARKSGLVDTGVRAAGGTGAASQNTGNNLSLLNLSGGDLAASNLVNKKIANQNLLNSLVKL